MSDFDESQLATLTITGITQPVAVNSGGTWTAAHTLIHLIALAKAQGGDNTAQP